MVKLPEMRPREPWGPDKLPNVVRDEFRRWYGDDYQDFIDRASPEKLEILVIDATSPRTSSSALVVLPPDGDCVSQSGGYRPRPPRYA